MVLDLVPLVTFYFADDYPLCSRRGDLVGGGERGQEMRYIAISDSRSELSI